MKLGYLAAGGAIVFAGVAVGLGSVYSLVSITFS